MTNKQNAPELEQESPGIPDVVHRVRAELDKLNERAHLQFAQ
jgi:hypothetical protein